MAKGVTTNRLTDYLIFLSNILVSLVSPRVSVTPRRAQGPVGMLGPMAAVEKQAK